MDFTIYGIGTAAIGVCCLLVGLLIGYRWGATASPGKPLLERQVDEIMKGL